MRGQTVYVGINIRLKSCLTVFWEGRKVHTVWYLYVYVYLYVYLYTHTRSISVDIHIFSY